MYGGDGHASEARKLGHISTSGLNTTHLGHLATPWSPCHTVVTSPHLTPTPHYSQDGKADCIKTHHNDTALVRKLRDQGRVVEPLKDFHKDEVSQQSQKTKT